MYLESSADNEMCWHLDWFPEEFCGRGWVKRRPERTQIIALHLETLIAIFHSLNRLWRSWGMTPGSWRATPACRTWLWWPCPPRGGPNPRGVREKPCIWFTEWRVQRKSYEPELHRPACLDEITWPSGRTQDESGVLIRDMFLARK